MRDVLPDLERWTYARLPVALATVIQTWGSSPRQAGAKMGIAPQNQITGSVSGGCIEGAVYEEGMRALEARQPRLLHFGVADETAWEVGLACGGSVDVFVQPLDFEQFARMQALLAGEQAFALATVVAGPADWLGDSWLVQDEAPAAGNLDKSIREQAEAAARASLDDGQHRRMKLRAPPAAAEGATGQHQEVEVFIEAYLPSPSLVIIGGAHISIALAALGKTLGYRTVVVDPRRAFGNEQRFPNVDELIQEWPDDALKRITITRNTAIAMLTHDPKLDDPALLVALNSSAFYVGALGSGKTQAKRRARLSEAGLTDAQLRRIHGPIGLNLAGRTPEEIALSIMAEIVATRNNAPAP